jgi:hypothetical protein
MLCAERGVEILSELVDKHFNDGEKPELTLEPLLLPSCGLMGDNRVYGYAWSLSGIEDFDDERTKRLMKEASLRLTNEITHDDGTNFVRVFVEVINKG